MTTLGIQPVRLASAGIIQVFPELVCDGMWHLLGNLLTDYLDELVHIRTLWLLPMYVDCRYLIQDVSQYDSIHVREF